MKHESCHYNRRSLLVKKISGKNLFAGLKHLRDAGNHRDGLSHYVSWGIDALVSTCPAHDKSRS